jgi:Mn2+/Fe2+ NRAMP family transporter
MRIVLFLGALGIVASGQALDPANPPASVFRLAAGEIGFRFFGVVMWAAAITSVVGSAYTSVSFLPIRPERRSAAIVGFITISTAIFLAVGRPVTILVVVGAINGLILPLGLGAMIMASLKEPYRSASAQPRWLLVAAAIVTVAMAGLGAKAIVGLL